MLKIKLFQRGKKHARTYRVVVAEQRSNRDGKYIDDIGWYNPKSNKLEINSKKMEDWKNKGAQITEGVRKIIKNETVS